MGQGLIELVKEARQKRAALGGQVFGGLGGLWTSEVSGTQLLTPKAVSPGAIDAAAAGKVVAAKMSP